MKWNAPLAESGIDLASLLVTAAHTLMAQVIAAPVFKGDQRNELAAVQETMQELAGELNKLSAKVVLHP